MTPQKSTIVWIVIVLMCVAIAYTQYGYFRQPVAGESKTGLEHNLVSTGVAKDGIPSLDEPVFESVAQADPYLDDAGYGIVVEAGARSRFYPYQILVWHEVVNDTFGGVPILVTYSPLCGAGLAFDRRGTDGPLSFGVSGNVYNNCPVLYDRADGSLVSQLDPGLPPYPSRVMVWQEYKRAYPRGQVLSRETGTVRDYTYDPYGDYEETHAVWFPLDAMDESQPLKAAQFASDGSIVQPHYWFSFFLKNKVFE
ncbi:DUF3179 domain-containing protein [Candidatus Parcubacteria bacterium]|nr:DUF3179 domain-containing protein [Candidatus Parcubacteria bacterium]